MPRGLRYVKTPQPCHSEEARTRRRGIPLPLQPSSYGVGSLADARDDSPVGTSTARPCSHAPAPPSVILSGATAGSAAEGSHAAQRSVCHPERSDRRERSRRILKTSYPFQRNAAKESITPRKKTKRSPRFRLHTFPITRPLPTRSFDSGFAFAQDDNVRSRPLSVCDPSGYAIGMTPHPSPPLATPPVSPAGSVRSRL